MGDAMRDEAFISDLRATMEDFEHADYEEEFTECASPDE
jgi:hypothetical protein